MKLTLIRLVIMSTALLLVGTSGCTADDSEEMARMKQAQTEQAQVEDERKKGNVEENAEQIEADEASLAKPSGKPDRPSPFVDRSCDFTLTATFKEIPAGARIIAASARDGRFQKVTRSEHSGVSGAVMPAEDGHNLFFVSDALKAGEYSYQAKYAITRRVGTQGSLDVARGADWQEGKTPKIDGASTDATLTKLAQGLGDETMKPYAVFHAAMAEAMKPEVGEDGSDDAVSVAGGNKATSHGVAALLTELMSIRGVPARVVQGMHRTKLEGEVKRGHAWAEFQLPGISWAPADPALRRRHTGEEDDPTYLGTIPADRITFLIGNDLVIPEDGTLPRTTLSGELVAPFALMDGKRVGTVTWTAEFSPQATDKR
jgi:hypothetical protein